MRLCIVDKKEPTYQFLNDGTLKDLNLILVCYLNPIMIAILNDRGYVEDTSKNGEYGKS
jgi:hypothetical protein